MDQILSKSGSYVKIENESNPHAVAAALPAAALPVITLFVNHLDSKLKYTDLFAASCGSLGEFTDIKQSEEGYAMTRQMKHFNFPVRNLDGTFYAQVHPFDPSFFAVKVHPSGVKNTCQQAAQSRRVEGGNCCEPQVEIADSMIRSRHAEVL